MIDFAANFFNLPIYEAAQRLAADFGIDTDRPPTKETLEKCRQQKLSGSWKTSGCAFLMDFSLLRASEFFVF